MILDLEKFIADEREIWVELDSLLRKLENDPGAGMDLEGIRRFHHLYQRTSSDLAKLQSFASEPDLKRYLESLIARGFGEIHETRATPVRISPLKWFLQSFPQAFRRRRRAFFLALSILMLGALFGGGLVMIDSEAKEAMFQHFDHLMGNPSERVAKEERDPNKTLERYKATFSSELMTHNIRVTVFCMALGVTMGIGTVILLFYNGAILGAVVLDYLRAGEATFLFGWLLPHGAIEIPAMLLGGQAGFVLAGALLGRRSGASLAERLRHVSSDLVTLIGGASVMLVWAGIIEAFFSQYHEPLVPYSLKIGFGVLELIVLSLLLSRCGKMAEAVGRKALNG